ncbi:uncharacterized protein JCM6883_002504 [Sporobolomyces salmoneus]|uniref:uncharacterized protein n=1 Tax=Sporobolomyces salmoneus TaxID=183962 RepID=UPI003170C419
MPVGFCCRLILFIVALYVSPLAIILYNYDVGQQICDGALQLNLLLWGGMLVCSFVMAVLGMTEASTRLFSWNLLYVLAALAGILALLACLHAIYTVCSCSDQARYPSRQMQELGKSRRRGGGAQRVEKEMPTHLNVQSSYMICDCRGQKDKKGIVKMRVPRSWVRNRKNRRQVGDEEENKDLSTDESFDEERTHMRRAMMPYVGPETHGKR